MGRTLPRDLGWPPIGNSKREPQLPWASKIAAGKGHNPTGAADRSFVGGAERAGLHRVRRSGLAAAGLVVLVGLGASGTAAALVHRAELRAAGGVMERHTRSVQGATRSETQRYVDAAGLVAAGLAAQPDLTYDGFRAVAHRLSALRLRGMSSAAFVTAVTADEVPAAEAHWRERGAADLTLRADGPGVGWRQEHLFPVLQLSLDGSAVLPGVDITVAPEPTAALVQARAIGRTAVSRPYVLLKDRGRPPADRQRAFVLAAPVIDPARRFLGWLVIAVRGTELMDGVLPPSNGRLSVSVYATGDQVPLARLDGGGDGSGRDLHREVSLTVADQEWILRVSADRAALPGANGQLDTGIAGAGVVLSGLLAVLFYVLATARTRMAWQVTKAIGEARTAELEARRQAGLLAAVMDSISDGVGVVDENGGLLMRNPAANQLLGRPSGPRSAAEFPDYYGMFRPDGETPWPPEELPIVAALRGEDSTNVEMVVRNPAHPDGIRLNVSARPLDPRAGQSGAVAVYHDITERRAAEQAIKQLNAELEQRVVERTAELAGKANELARRSAQQAVQAEQLRAANAELEAFSYSVSHDLRAPLRAVDGFARMLELDHSGSLDEKGRRYVARVRAGAQQMGELIDGLLAFSRLQRQAMTIGRVRIEALVDDVWQELAPDRAGRAVELTVGALPPATGDPRLLRHVVANLLSNALKYTRGRDPARIEVGVADGAYFVRDNGAGFDPRYADKLFQVFQRLHRVEDYEGTGVGLALASRIIQRHGGRIWADAEPDRGATFHFTLPTALEAADAVRTEEGAPRRGQSERSGAGAARV
jgi:signal transduction histidine kinase